MRHFKITYGKEAQQETGLNGIIGIVLTCTVFSMYVNCMLT